MFKFRKSDHFEKNDSWLKIASIYLLIVVGCIITVYPILNVFSISMRPGSSLMSTSLAIFPNLDKLIYKDIAFTQDGKKGFLLGYKSYVFRSEDSGKSWDELSTIKVGKEEMPTELSWQSVAVSSDGSTVALVEQGMKQTETGSLLISKNFGDSWTKVDNTFGCKWKKVKMTPDGKIIAAIGEKSTGSEIYLSEDNGVSWKALSAGSKDWRSLLISADGKKLMAFPYDDAVSISTDGGLKWSELRSIAKNKWVSASATADGKTIYAVTDNDMLYVSNDEGKTWAADNNLGKLNWASVSVSEDGKTVSCAAEDQFVFVSNDAGKTWTKTVLTKNVEINDTVVTTAGVFALQYKGYAIKIDGGIATKLTGLVSKFHFFDNYIKVFIKYDIISWLKNSFIVAFFSTIFGLLVSITAGYAFSRYVFKGRKFGLSMLFVTQMFPITMLLLPLYVMLIRIDHFLSDIGIAFAFQNSFVGLIVIYTAMAIPFNIWMIKGYFDTIPKSLEESAYVDGCTTWQAFYIVMLPLAKPALALSALFSFMGSWSEYMVARVILNDPDKLTLPIGITNMQGQFSTDWGIYSATALITAIPVMIVFISLSKYLVGGLSAGAVKE